MRIRIDPARWIGLSITGLGIALILMALFFKKTGLDPENVLGLQEWGRRRIGLVLIGSLLLPSFLYITSYNCLVCWIGVSRSRFAYKPLPFVVGFLDLASGKKQRFKLNWRPVFAWLLLLLPAILLSLHLIGAVPLAWSQTPLSNIEHLNGNAYLAPQLSSFYIGGSPAIVYEDGRPLPYPTYADYRMVVERGQGYYSINRQAVFFSATDNSDPRSNGRDYFLVAPAAPNLILAFLIFFTAVIATVSFALRYRYALVGVAKRPPFYLSAGIFVLFFVIHRLWFFVDFPIPAIHPDSGSYFAVAESIGAGDLPRFGDRSPLVPLLMKFVYSISDRVMAMVVTQTLLSFISGLLMIFAVHCLLQPLSPWAALMMAGYISSFNGLEYDTAILSESIYTSCLVFAFAFLLLGFGSNKKIAFFGASTFFALVILTKPAGYYLLVSYVLILVFLLWNKYSHGLIISFSFPMLAILLTLCIYNYYTLGMFTLSSSDATELTLITNLYWETDPVYPPDINAAIENVQTSTRERISSQDLDILYNGWDMKELYRIYLYGHYYGPQTEIANMTGGWGTPEWRIWLLRLSKDAILKHPDYYFKHLVVMMDAYFAGVGQEHEFSAYIKNRVMTLYINKHFSAAKENPFMVRLAKEFADADPPPTVRITDYDINTDMNLDDRVLLVRTPAWRLYYLGYLFRKVIFARLIWRLVYLVSGLASAWQLLRHRGRHQGAFILFIMTISVLGAGLIVSLAEYSQPRYSYPMEWVYYLSLILLPMIFVPKNNVPADDKAPVGDQG